MKSAEVRQSFIDYFVERGHAHLPSSPLVPQGDATLLFTNAGMVPFKDHFLGRSSPPSPRAVTAQKCMRVSGKHNDLENVGPSPRHHTFFEMLGNFSFGDYFKAEAIEFAWELVTEVWGLPADRLFATVFEEDDQAEALWHKISGLHPSRVHRCGEKDNFWAMGDTGPCGPCSEIFVDLRPDQPPVDFFEGSENGRYLEIWNLVFMQFDRNAEGRKEPLPNPSIDTGAGLERLTAVLQGVESNYDTDLFLPLVRAAAVLADRPYGLDREDDVAMRVIADHLRAVTFLLADGVIPSNEGRGYVLRRILRRAVRHGMSLGLEEPFLHRLVPVVGEALGDDYEELGSTQRASVETVEVEETKFLSTVATASRHVQQAIDRARANGRNVLDGPTVFRFYDTFGLPAELIREIAEEERFKIDEEGFAEALEEQRTRSRASGTGKSRVEAAERGLHGGPVQPSEFIGYEELEYEGAVVEALAAPKEDGAWERVRSLSAGSEGVARLHKTPFYAESGGQIGDRGRLSSEGGGSAQVTDTQKTGSGVYLHFLTVEEGEISETEIATASVSPEHRLPTQRNHTATHLLHAALRHVLGAGVRQAGSLVSPDRLRFDFTYGQPVDPRQLAEIETIVNRWILEARDVSIVENRDFEEARAAGAMALFGEKYGDRVRTVEVPGSVGSLELCGGCHVANSGEIGLLLILAERGVASGVRRIEAVTGEAAHVEIERRKAVVSRVAAELGVPDERLADEIRLLKERIRELELDLSKVRMKLVSGGTSADEGVEVDGVRILAREVPMAPAGELRNMADVLRGKIGSGVVILGTRDEDKVSLIVTVTKDVSGRVAAGSVVRELAPIVGGGGGGRADFAQAGGKRPEALDRALREAPEVVRRLLA